MWGMNASDAEAFKESPYTLVLTLKDGGMGVMAEYLTEGDDPFMLDLEWNWHDSLLWHVGDERK